MSKHCKIMYSIWLILALPAIADPIRVAMWNTDYSRKGPGLLIKELLKDEEEWDQTASSIIALQADFLLLVDVDQDDEGWAAELIAQKFGFAHYSLSVSNRGIPFRQDINHDEWIDGDDTQGFGDFRGQNSMLLLSQPTPNSAQSYSKLLLKDFSSPPMLNDEPFYEDTIWNALRLSPTGLWNHDFTSFQLLSAYAATPAFDGAEQRNIKRNAAELRWWSRYLSGEAFTNDEGIITRLNKPFILMGSLNLDPEKGRGERLAIQDLLAHPPLNPVEFERRATVDWRDLGLGEMRVDYILPSCEFETLSSGQLDMGTSHALIWADLTQHPDCEY